MQRAKPSAIGSRSPTSGRRKAACHGNRDKSIESDEDVPGPQNTPKHVPRQHLIRTLWPDSFVQEGNLADGIFMLRKAPRSRGSKSPAGGGVAFHGEGTFLRIESSGARVRLAASELRGLCYARPEYYSSVKEQ
jgi:hypothetical protein